MPYLYNTVNGGTNDELRFYNFISNQFPAGVPTALTPTIERTPSLPATPGVFTNSRPREWFTDYGFNAAHRLYNGNRYYYYFPAIAGTPTANELLTGVPTTTTNYRFQRVCNQDAGPMNSNDYRLNVNAYDGTGITNIEVQPNFGTNTNGQNEFNIFNFAVKSNTTYVSYGFRTIGATNDLLVNMNRAVIHISGWLHDGIYGTPPIREAFRYNNCFLMSVRWDSTQNTSCTFTALSPNQRLTTFSTSYTLRHKPIVCQTGQYAPGLFLTDLILYEDLFPSYPAAGKLDNRVVCLGRGNFVPGRIYRVENVFGRTGTEDWLCASYLVPSSLAFTSWSTTTTDPSYISAWAVNQEDRIMIRMFTEAD